MGEMLPTFFTSNKSFTDLEEHLTFTKDGKEPIKAARVMERVRFLAEEAKLGGDNLRNQ
jgi:primosomal protein DnaI